jgi:ATP-binding cassette subfamily B protein RaxB
MTPNLDHKASSVPLLRQRRGWRLRNRKIKPILQAEAAECGLACLAMIRNYYGGTDSLQCLRESIGTSVRGTSVAQLIQLGSRLQLKCVGLKAKLEYLLHAKYPCILHWNFNHYVVLTFATKDRAEIIDPALGRMVLPLREVSTKFTGILITVYPSEQIIDLPTAQGASNSAGLGKLLRTYLRPVARLIALATIIELIAATLPYQAKIILDVVLPGGDQSLLVILTISFLALTLIQFALSLSRTWLATWITGKLGSEWTEEIFHRLLQLPVTFFERRHIGGIVSRFTSVQLVQETLTTGSVEVLLDLLVCIVALTALLLQSLPISFLIIGGALAITLAKLAFYGIAWHSNERYLHLLALQQNDIIESVRGIQTLKLFNREPDRERRLRALTLNSAKQKIITQRVTSYFQATNTWFAGAQRMVVLGVGSAYVMRNEFSLGTLIEYVMYADMFALRIGPLVDRFLDFRMLLLHTHRISDITQARPEAAIQIVATTASPATIQLTDVSFRYSDDEPWIIRNLNLSVRRGDSIAITGPSGSGKSTLVKIMSGLVPPSSGQIVLCGIRLDPGCVARNPSLVGVVLQDDSLFAGSIAQNISNFDRNARLTDIKEAAKMAAIHEDIDIMPMKYETMVGDMGSVLSGDQRQRIALARALYYRPKILILDEATSALDQANEIEICRRIAALDITRITFAHREETLRSAARVIDLRDLQ